MQVCRSILVVVVAATYCWLHLLPATANQEDEATFDQVQDKWQRLSDNVDVDQINPPPSTRYLNQDAVANPPTPSETIVDLSPGIQVTQSLLSWISGQCENMIEEIEAIAKQNSVAKTFSPVNYLRYLFLYERLQTISRQPYQELKWIKRKINIFGNVYRQSIYLLRNYLEDQNLSLMKVEDKEPKSKQVSVSDAWMGHYLNIRYIAVHAPKNSKLSVRAVELLAYSPENNPLRQRSARFEVKTRAFSR